MYSVFLAPQHWGVGFRNWSLWASPKKLSAYCLVKHRVFSPAFYSQVSSHHQSLGLLSTYLRLLYLFQQESREHKKKALQRKSENKSLQFFSTTFILPILAEDVLFTVSKPFKPTQVLKNTCFPLHLIDQSSLSFYHQAPSLENNSFYLGSDREINQLDSIRDQGHVILS